MSQFSRRARWLNQLFPQSTAPTQHDPGVRSDDVSLVQPYDGGGIGFQEPTTLIKEFEIPVGIAESIDCLVNGEDVVARIYAMGVLQVSGTDATVFMTVISGAGVAIGVAVRDLAVAATTLLPFVTISDFKILGPSCTLRANTRSGGADSLFRVQIYAAVAPLGTVFVP